MKMGTSCDVFATSLLKATILYTCVIVSHCSVVVNCIQLIYNPMSLGALYTYLVSIQKQLTQWVIYYVVGVVLYLPGIYWHCTRFLNTKRNEKGKNSSTKEKR